MEEIEVGGWTYPPGVALVVSTYLLHHDPDVYPDPYAFRPERFLENGPGTYTWTPFGGGRRRCLGASFATQEMKIVLRRVLAECRIAAGIDGPEMTRRRNITVRPGEGARTVISDREPATAPAQAPTEAAA
jgi:cytochrome P450